MKRFIIRSDGGSRGNPGPAAYGFVVYDEKGNLVASEGRFLGTMTNNQAEYHGLIAALKKAHALGGTHIEAILDSELLVRQLTGQYKIKDTGLKERAQEVLKLTNHFSHVHFRHAPREENQEADRLVNEALDEQK